MALGDGRKALQEQTRYLLGTGPLTTTTTNWEGEKVLAFYLLINQLGRGLVELLDVQSQDYAKAQATAQVISSSRKMPGSGRHQGLPIVLCPGASCIWEGNTSSTVFSYLSPR